MRVLRALAALVYIRLCGNVIRAVFAAYQPQRRLLRLFRYAHGIRPHVGYKSRHTPALKLYTFIKLLGNEHCKLCREAKLS